MIRLTANMTTGSDHDTVTWDERVVSYKKLTHWNIAQCFSKIKSDLENVSFSLEDAKTFFGNLGIAIPPYGHLQYHDGKNRDNGQRVKYELTLNNLDLHTVLTYKFYLDYLQDEIVDASFLIEAENFNHSGQEYLFGLDISKGFKGFFSGKFVKDKSVLRLTELSYNSQNLISNGVDIIGIDDKYNFLEVGLLDNTHFGPFPKVLSQNHRSSYEILKLFVDDTILIEIPDTLKQNPIVDISK